MAEQVKVKYEGPTGVIAKAEYAYSSTYTCTDVEKRLVEVVSVTQCKDKVKVYNRNVFDFTGLDNAEILEIASKTIMIAARGPEYRSRSSKEALGIDGNTLMAKDYFKRERKSKSFEDKVSDLENGAWNTSDTIYFGIDYLEEGASDDEIMFVTGQRGP